MPGCPGPPVRKSRTPRGASVLSALATARSRLATSGPGVVERHPQRRAGEVVELGAGVRRGQRTDDPAVVRCGRRPRRRRRPAVVGSNHDRDDRREQDGCRGRTERQTGHPARLGRSPSVKIAAALQIDHGSLVAGEPQAAQPATGVPGRSAASMTSSGTAAPQADGRGDAQRSAREPTTFALRASDHCWMLSAWAPGTQAADQRLPDQHVDQPDHHGVAG